MLGVKGSVGVMWGGEGNVVEVFYFSICSCCRMSSSWSWNFYPCLS